MTDQPAATTDTLSAFLTPEAKRQIFNGLIDGLKQTQLPEFAAYKGSYDIPVTVGVMAALLNCSDRQVQLYSKEHNVSKEHRGRYFLIDSLWSLVRHLRNVASRNGGDKTLEELRKEGQAIENQIKQIELEKARGELLTKTDVEKAAFERGQRTKQAMENIPARISALLAAERDQLKVREILGTEISQALEELSR